MVHTLSDTLSNLDITFPKPDIRSAGLQTNISIIISTSGTFTSLHNLVFSQNGEAIATKSQHLFYIPGDVRSWSESFNISNFHYFLHSVDPSVDHISLTWQYGMPPLQGSTYGTRKCHRGDDTEWRCVRRNCRGCPWTYGWLVCEGQLRCTGEEMTWVYDNDGQACNHENRLGKIQCGEENEFYAISIPGDSERISGRRRFSFWTVAGHRLRKFLFGWMM